MSRIAETMLGDQSFVDLFSLAASPAPPAAPVDLTKDIPPQVVDLFEKLALEVRRKGHAHYSADAILHRIRWHFSIERGDADFKCNNNWTAPLARWAMKRHPVELNGFFELRKSKLRCFP